LGVDPCELLHFGARVEKVKRAVEIPNRLTL
jgi:hypothetical protein